MAEQEAAPAVVVDVVVVGLVAARMVAGALGAGVVVDVVALPEVDVVRVSAAPAIEADEQAVGSAALVALPAAAEVGKGVAVVRAAVAGVAMWVDGTARVAVLTAEEARVAAGVEMRTTCSEAQSGSGHQRQNFRTPLPTKQDL